MSGFTLRDSPPFDDWQFLESECLRRDYALALECLASACEARAEYRPAIEHARRWLALDSLNEAAHRALMRLHVLAGQRNAALRQYRECVRILDEELGVPPLEETADLHRAILENRYPTPTAPRRPSPTPPRAPATELPRLSLPFVGRRQELEALLSLYAQTGRGGRLAVVEGEAGVGKTRLVEEFLRRLPPAETVVVMEQCYPEAGHLPYAPLIQGLRKAIASESGSQALQGVDEIWLAELSRLVPELAARLPIASRPPSLDAPNAQSRFLEGVTQGLLAILRSRPRGVLCFDNVHWADAASADALAYFARQMATHPLLLLLTWRSGDLSVGSPLRAMAAEAARGGNGVMLSLERLARYEVRELVRSSGVWEAPAAEVFSDRLFLETEGLPFFLVEYLEMLPGQSAERAVENWPLPKGVRDLFAARLAQLNQTARQLITACAWAGRKPKQPSITGRPANAPRRGCLVRPDWRGEGRLAAGDLETGGVVGVWRFVVRDASRALPDCAERAA